MTITIENKEVSVGRVRQQSPTALLKSAYGGKKIGEMFAVPLASLKVYPGFNKRINYDLDDLKEFIKQNGISFPALRLMHIDGELYIDEGHRRQMACVELDLPGDTPIPVYIGESSSPEERLARQVTSNAGKNYTFIEMVAVAKELIQKHHNDQNTVSKLIGKSQGAVSNMTKFFGYSQLMFTAINEGDIKYTRVLELQRKGLNESAILEIIAREKHTTSTQQLLTDSNDDITDSELLLSDDDSELDDVVVVQENDVIKSESLDITKHTTLSPTELSKLDKLVSDSGKTAKVVKSAGKAVAVDRSTLASKKSNPAKLLTDFLACAEIIDNGDGKVTYTVSLAEHNALQRGANNM
jgi:ParB/RepB/Spo0J family partition protein